MCRSLKQDYNLYVEGKRSWGQVSVGEGLGERSTEVGKRLEGFIRTGAGGKVFVLRKI